MNARTAVFVMLREMQREGPHPSTYSTKPLPRHLHGLTQANLKINREQIRVIYAVYGTRIVVLSVFKKTSPQVERREYETALARKKTVEALIQGGEIVPTIH